MIIDDDEDSTNLFKIFLEFHGYEIHAYTDSIEAFHSFKKNSHDLIILDLHMPKMDGITLYKEIKQIDDKVIICLSLKDFKNKIDSLLLSKYE